MEKNSKITLGGGCFWCVEALFNRIRGVEEVISGYAGGVSKEPNYEQVSGGQSGHVESVQIIFDPKEISYKELLYIFFRVHDPTTMNRQGADVGGQYKSVVFHENEEQKKQAKESLKEAQKEYEDKIVTKILPLKRFYKAEEYHQKYYVKHQGSNYCTLVIDPKVKKLEERFSKYVKV